MTAPSVPYKLVPVEPTEEMYRAAYKATKQILNPTPKGMPHSVQSREKLRLRIKAAIQAAPAPPTVTEGEIEAVLWRTLPMQPKGVNPRYAAGVKETTRAILQLLRDKGILP